VFALGKCGGRELGFASDIELMFVYAGDGKSDGEQPMGAPEFFIKLVECVTHAIYARREGIFEIDLRLRPYGKAGSLAVSLEAFDQYFRPEGPAWPFERQALVKLRPIGGNFELGNTLVRLRDEFLYTGKPFDVVAMRAMRERQVNQLVTPGTFNAKLSPGGAVDIEYLVQGLQITHGHKHPNVRNPNTRRALEALATAGIIRDSESERLEQAYVFLRSLIDGLRIVRGNAKDLTVPEPGTEEFAFLARRLGYNEEPERLERDLTETSEFVREASFRLLG
jgi:glutamate-ammonia-ligase adenylyltransferase